MGFHLGLVERLESVNSYGKRQCKRLLWRARAAVKKAMKNSGGKKQVKFQYDPSSYALNFDDGGANADKFSDNKFEDCADGKNIIWVYVLRVKS